MLSPLLIPVKVKDKKIIVLDETALPFKETYIEVTSLEGALDVLAGMKTRALGQVLLFFYCCVLFGGAGAIDGISREFSRLRPTFDFPMLADILRRALAPGVAVSDVVGGFIRGFDQARRARAKNLAALLPNPANVLTICNVNGELIYLYEELIKQGKEAMFYVVETRPYLQGTRLTFWELKRENIPVRVVCDCQSAQLMKEKKVNVVVCGADRASTKGDIINKIGTYPLARLGRHFGISFYPLTQYPRNIDLETVEIEERPPQEVFMFLEGSFSQIDAFYPAFDVTASEYITENVKLETAKQGQ